MTVGTLAGTKVLILHIGAILLSDSTSDPVQAQMRARAIRESATIAIDTALSRSQSGVEWVTLEQQRRAARRNPTVAVNPDRLATEMLTDPSVERVPPSLTVGMRALAAMTSSRYGVVPAALYVAEQNGQVYATFLIVLADSRTSNVLARLKASGTGSTIEAALLAAASSIIADQ